LFASAPRKAFALAKARPLDWSSGHLNVFECHMNGLLRGGSARPCDNATMEGQTMPARRLAIASLTVLAAGAAVTVLVAETSRRAESWEIGLYIPCVFEEGLVCRPPRR
jgi:hypothetical protein